MCRSPHGWRYDIRFKKSKGVERKAIEGHNTDTLVPMWTSLSLSCLFRLGRKGWRHGVVLSLRIYGILIDRDFIMVTGIFGVHLSWCLTTRGNRWEAVFWDALVCFGRIGREKCFSLSFQMSRTIAFTVWSSHPPGSLLMQLYGSKAHPTSLDIHFQMHSFVSCEALDVHKLPCLSGTLNMEVHAI